LPLYNQDDDGQSVHRSEHTAQAWLSNICAMYCRI
jgi:hypothetical protein